MNSIKRLEAIFFPNKCPFCDEIIKYDKTMCETCENNIDMSLYRKKLVLENGIRLQVFSPFLYKDSIKRTIYKLKFREKKNYARNLGSLMAQTCKRGFFKYKIDYVTSVPLHKTRLNERGYNQSKLLAKSVSRELGVPYVDLIVKVRNNETQHELPLLMRTENVKGVYVAKKGIDLKDKTILICDDVVTTGNTISECTLTLYEAGAGKILGLSLALVSQEK